MIRRTFLMLVLCLLPALAHGQSKPVFQSGTMVPGDLAKFFTNGLIGDAKGIAGDIAGKGVNPFAITDVNALGLCSNNASTLGAYNAFCLGHDANGNGLLSLDSYGGLGNKTVYLRKNGTLYEFPFTLSGAVGPGTTKSGNTALWNNGVGTLLSDGGRQPLKFNPRDNGAACDGSTDDFTALQAAITAAQNAAGGQKVVYIDCAMKIAAGSPTISADNVTIEGDNPGVSQILCRTGTLDCIKTDGAAQRAHLRLRNLTIDGTSQTGGNCISANGVSDIILEHVAMTNCWNGLLAQWVNNVTVKDHTTIAARNPSGYAIKYYTDPSTGKRSDVLNLLDGTINNAYSGADGIVWDGAAYTLRIANFNVIATKAGFKVLNTAACTGSGGVPVGCLTASGAGYPQFADILHLEVDGASAVACDIETGFDFMITASICSNQTGGSGQGSADTAALLINPDTSGGITRNIRLSNSHIGNARNQAALINGCQNCYSSNNVFDDASHAGSGSFPTVETGANVANLAFVGGKMGPTFGNVTNSSYGLKVGGGGAGIYAIGVDYNGNLTGSIQDLSANATRIGGTDFDGKTLGFDIGGLGPNPGLYYSRTRAAGIVEGRVRNQGTTNGTTAELIAELNNVANSYINLKVSTDGANPTATIDSGTGNTGGLVVNVGAGAMKVTGLGNTPTGKQPVCIDTATGQLYKGSGGAC